MMKTPAVNSSSPRQDIAIRSLLQVQARQSQIYEWNNSTSPKHCFKPKPNNFSSSFSKILGGSTSRNNSSFSIKQKHSPRNSIQSIEMTPAVIQMSDSDKIILENDRINSMKNIKSNNNSYQKQVNGSKVHLSNRQHQYAKVISRSGEKEMRKEGRIFDQYRFGLIKSVIDNGEEFIRYKQDIFDRDRNNIQQPCFYNTQGRDNNPFALRNYFLRKSLSVGHQSPKGSEFSVESELKKTYQKIVKNNQNADQNQSITVRHLLKNLQEIQKKKENCLPSAQRFKAKAQQNDALKIRKLRYQQYGNEKYKELMDNLKITHSKQKKGFKDGKDLQIQKGNSILNLNKEAQCTSNGRHFRKNSNQRK